ncbi:esterase-like activity of phytase family protein [Sphingomonas sp. NFR15]|uniref:esterase-like activity of phytase family protein n=1 Tax=Sphingomonas sp. NFR15 TaxID=1566282 RepID=UPI000883739D|nr:esterase-like activity of phytase family protein [Sphingomonas sp. NFR15]SDA19823.1 Uncharacterized conserved protein [Sphingomonas sp. NFR15]
MIERIVLPPSAAGEAVGGISGIDYDRRRRAWLLISDDKSQHGPARLYRLRLTRMRPSLAPVLLRDERGGVYPAPGSGKEAIDGEAIRLTPDGQRFAWSSEGDAEDGFGPAVRISDAGGRVRDSIPLPAAIKTDGRPNRTVEGLAFTPDHALWVAMEAPLRRDGPAADIDHAALVRFTRIAPGAPPRQIGYRVDPIVRQRPNRLADNGVSEILAVDDDRLLVLERSGEQQDDGRFAFHCRLYLAYLRGADPVSLTAPLDPSRVRVATKRLLVDFDRLMPTGSGNLEGMAWWPGAHGRHRRLVLVNDNNFAPDEATILTVIELPPLSPLSRDGLG